MSTSFNILLTNSTDIYGGGEFYVVEVAKALRERGHNVHVACKPNNLLRVKCEESSIHTIPVDFPSHGQLLNNILNLKNIIYKHRIHIIHTNSNYDRTAGAFAAKLAGVAHVTNIHSFHSIQHNLTQWLRNRRATDRFIVDGFCVKELLVDNDHIPSEKISVIHLGVDPESMRRDGLLRQKIRAEFALNEEHIIIGNVGRLVPMKGQEYLLRAFGKLVHSHPNARLVLVGDGELRDKLVQIADRLNIKNSIILTGFRDDLQALYSAFDIYAHSSIEGGGETFPFAVLQALAQELPAIVTRVGDVPHMVTEGVNGFIVPDGNADAIADRLQILVENSSLRHSMARRSRELLLKYFTVSKMVDAVESVYLSIKQNRRTV